MDRYERIVAVSVVGVTPSGKMDICWDPGATEKDFELPGVALSKISLPFE
jgi:hypothetical protein